MSKYLNDDSKIQMRLNIKRHRQKLLQYLENTNDTFLKPKIKLISNDIEKSNLNHNDKRKTRSSVTVKQPPNFQPHNENDCNDSSIIEEVKYYGQEQLANDKSKEKYMHYSCDSDNPILDINYPPTTKRKIMKIKKTIKSPQARDKQNAKERESRNCLAKRFQTLRKYCSYLCTNRRVPSKCSILLAAKKECDLLTYYNKKMLEEKIYWKKKNEILESRINELKNYVYNIIVG